MTNNSMTEEEMMAVNCSFERHRKAMIRAGQDKKHVIEQAGKSMFILKRTYTNNMKLEIVNHHYLIHLDGHVALVDWGSPESFAKESIMIEMGDRKHCISASPALIDQVNDSGLIGETEIDVLLGTDILNEHCIMLDKVSGTFAVDDGIDVNGMYVLPIKQKSIMGQTYVVANAKFNGREHDFILDTGAWVGYATADVIGDAPEVGTIKDYSPIPILGNINTPKHEIELEIAGYKDPFHAIGLMPEMLAMMMGMLGVEVVMGLDDLVKEVIVFDIPHSLVAFK